MLLFEALPACVSEMFLNFLPNFSLVLLRPSSHGTQLLRSIFVPISGTDKLAVHTGTEQLRTNFVLC